MAEYIRPDTKTTFTPPPDQIRGQDSGMASNGQYKDADKVILGAEAAGNPHPIGQVEPSARPEITKDAIENTVPPPYANTVENPSSSTQLDQAGKQQTVVTCPFCRQSVTTRVEAHSSGATVACAIGLGLICTCLVCIPCIAGWFEDIEHSCPRCYKRLARKRHGKKMEIFRPPTTTLDDAPKHPPTQHQGVNLDNPTTNEIGQVK